MLGFSGGGHYALHDTWTYTNVLKQIVQSLWLPIGKPETINLFLFLALFLGMLLSAWQRGSWRLQWRRLQVWPGHLIGGALMDAGAVLIPGGNDTLMLKSIPGLSPHASFGNLGYGRPDPSARVLHAAVQRSFSKWYHASSRGCWPLLP